MSTTATNILASIEAIETYASSIEASSAERRSRLLRIIKALARIAHQRARFKRMPLREEDESDGDSSYPPEVFHNDYTGPRLFEVVAGTTKHVPTERGFYHAWQASTIDQGFYISPAGALYGCAKQGTGIYGQFDAHPGDYGVDIDISWSLIDSNDVPDERLEDAVRKLLAVAFPYAKRDHMDVLLRE